MRELFEWADYVVVGSGLGASAFATRLSARAKNVLVLEVGEAVKRDRLDWDANEILIRGRYEDTSLHPPVDAYQYGSKEASKVQVRPVVGGMSVFYGAAAFRMRENDFLRFPTGLSYQTFEPYYEEAEKLLNVHGDDTSDPSRPHRNNKLLPAIEPSRETMVIRNSAKKLGLSPFPIPLAIRFATSQNLCAQCNTCDGFPCQVNAKMDGDVILRDGAHPNLKVITGVFVESFHYQNGAVDAVTIKTKLDSAPQTFAVKNLVLGAGAIGSAAVVLKSVDKVKTKLPSMEHFGTHLMRHANAVVGAVFFRNVNPTQKFVKQTVLSDFYEAERKTTGYAVGVIQDIYTPAPVVIKHFAPKYFAYVASKVSGYIQNLLCVAEDEPQRENRVSWDGERIRVVHNYTSEDIRRRDVLIKSAKKILTSAGGMFPKVMEISSFSHALGTLRMGTSSDNSATDVFGKIWGLSNLWCVDSSVLPVSAGVNPSLTIFANALRIADHVLDSAETR